MERHDWRHSSWSLQRQGQEWRKFPRHCPPIFELQELRACLSELRQKNTELRAQLQPGEERERKHPRSLATSSLELAPLSRAGAQCGPGVGQSVPLMGDASLQMETLINNTEASQRSNRFNPLSGEFEWERHPTQAHISRSDIASRHETSSRREIGPQTLVPTPRVVVL